MKQLRERNRLEKLSIEGKLDIVARRDIKESKTYDQYVLESKALNTRLMAKYGASQNAKPPMSSSPI